MVYHAGKPIESVVYCIQNIYYALVQKPDAVFGSVSFPSIHPLTYRGKRRRTKTNEIALNRPRNCTRAKERDMAEVRYDFFFLIVDSLFEF